MPLKQACFCAAWFTAVCAVAFVGIMTVTNSWTSITATVFARNSAALHVTSAYSSASHVLNEAWGNSAIVVVLAVVGTIIALNDRLERKVLLSAYLAAASLAFPVAQAYEDTAVSLKKHVAYGCVFAVLIAGYGVSRIGKYLSDRRYVAAICGFVVLTIPGAQGVMSAASWFQSWPNQSTLTARIAPLLADHPSVLVSLEGGTYFCQYYYAKYGNAWEGCSNSLNLYQIKAAVSDIIVLGYPASIAPPSGFPASLLLSRNATSIQYVNALEQAIYGGGVDVRSSTPEAQFADALEKSKRYVLVAIGPCDSNSNTIIYTIWKRVPPTGTSTQAKKVVPS